MMLANWNALLTAMIKESQQDYHFVVERWRNGGESCFLPFRTLSISILGCQQQPPAEGCGERGARQQSRRGICHISYKHVSECSCLFIRIIADSLKRCEASAEAFAFHALPLPPSVFVCCVQWSVHQFIHLPPHVHPTARSVSPGPFCPLIAFDRSVLIFICAIGPVSLCQSQRATNNLDPFGHRRGNISAACLWQSLVTSWPLTLHIWWMGMSLERTEWHGLPPADILTDNRRFHFSKLLLIRP